MEREGKKQTKRKQSGNKNYFLSNKTPRHYCTNRFFAVTLRGFIFLGGLGELDDLGELGDLGELDDIGDLGELGELDDLGDLGELDDLGYWIEGTKIGKVS